MKTNLLFKCFAAAILLTISTSVFAQNTLSGTCPGSCDPSGGGAVAGNTDAFYLLINTETNGDVTFTILGVPNNTSTAFRNYGWADGVVTALTVNGDANTGNKYFTRTISSDKMKITLVKQSTIPAGATIDINGILEYRTATSGDESNLWPTVDVNFVYGTTCNFTQTKLAAPVISNIGTDKKITFSTVTNAASYMAYVFRGTDLVYSQAVYSGDAINFTPTVTYNYTVKLIAVSGDVNYLNSDYSTGYTWSLSAGTVTLDPSIYCNTLIGANTNDYAYLSWQTDASGNVVISISGYAGDTGAAFRAAGMGDISRFTVNGNPASNYFTKTYTAGTNTYTLTLISGASIVKGDKISYSSGYIEWVTSKNLNAYGIYEFPNYVYGSDCSSLPTVTANPADISFSPTLGTQTFTVTGTNLTGIVTLTPPKGITVTPATITPSNGSINQSVTATWTGGTSSGSAIQISGGGLVSNVPVLISTSGFSDYCNKVIYQENGSTWPAYMSVDMSSDKTQMIFTIAPYNAGETTVWNRISNVVVNGGTANDMVSSNVVSTDKTQITVTFTHALQTGDAVTFGNPMVWEVTGSTSNNNVYINALQGPYSVGSTCSLDTSTATPNIHLKPGLYIYPNPATDYLNVSPSVCKVDFYSLQGQLIRSVTNNGVSLNITDFTKGLYLVRLSDKQGNYSTQKLEIR